MNAAPKQSLRQRVSALRNLGPFLRQVWNTSPALTLATIALRLCRALLPVTMLYVAKLVIDAVVTLAQAPRSAEGRTAAVALLEPHREQLRLEPEATVHFIRLSCFAASLPPMGGIRETTNHEIADVVLHGVLARES